MNPVSKATLRYLKTSAQKTRLVVNQIRGKTANEAMSILRFTRKHVAKDVEKVLKSAIANAKQGERKVDVDSLYISRAFVNAGPMEKRIRHRAMGRTFRILKRSCHVTLHLDEKR
ncbi:MAG: 50S ribosomal protein L22 [Acidobacteriota bacterium]